MLGGTEGYTPLDQRQVLDTRNLQEVPFPEDPDARFDAVFAAIGNSEAKCVDLLLLRRFLMSSYEMHSEFNRVTKGVWKTNYSTEAGWARNSLVNIGLVAEADTLFYGSSEFVTGYRLTEAGESFGQPVAAFLLQKSLELPFPLNKLGTSSKRFKERPIVSRVKILEYLVYTPELKPNTKGVARAVGLEELSVGRHLRDLASLGLIDYSFFSNDRHGDIKYKLHTKTMPDQIQTAAKMPVITSLVKDVIFYMETLDRHSVTEEIKKRHPGLDVNPDEIRKVLADLSRKGLIVKIFGDPNSGRVRDNSLAVITESGMNFVLNVIEPIRSALTPEGSARLDEWKQLPWQDSASEGVSKHKATSNHANRLSLEESISEVMDHIIRNPGITRRKIEVGLDRHIGSSITALKRDGRVKQVKNGGNSKMLYSADYPFPET